MLVAKNFIKQFAGAFVIASLVACGSSETDKSGNSGGEVGEVLDDHGTTTTPSTGIGVTPTPAASPTPAPTVTPSPTVEQVPTDSPVTTPTDTVTPTPTPTPTTDPTSTPLPTPTPPDLTGWVDIKDFLVESGGNYQYSLGDTSLAFNDTRDTGSKIVYFDTTAGNNTTGEAYWWDGEYIVDSTGSRNASNGDLYGTDPTHPNENAIKPFANMLEAKSDDRLKTQRNSSRDWFSDGLAGGYPDWFLFKRGQTHRDFKEYLYGGRSESEPMVISAYGIEAEGRATFHPNIPVDALDQNDQYYGYVSPFNGHNYGHTEEWIHLIVNSIEFRGKGFGMNSATKADSRNPEGGPVTAFLQDCKFFNIDGNSITGQPKKTTVYRSVISHGYRESAHNQGYYTSGYEQTSMFDETIFYRNGYKENPLYTADPKRDRFSRNIYQGGGSQMGHLYRNVISADGASGSPQMRMGGTLEKSLIIEGYFYSSTESNGERNPWLESGKQAGQSAVVRNNVQFIFRVNTPKDPDYVSDGVSQPGHGFTLSGSTFGSIVENNIISSSMLIDDLGGSPGVYGFSLYMGPYAHGDTAFNHQRNTVRNNIFHRVNAGLYIEGDATGASNNVIEDNVVVNAGRPVFDVTDDDTLVNATQWNIRNNQFYSRYPILSAAWIGPNSHVLADDLADAASIAKSEQNWPDPDRTLKQYVTEYLGLTILDWSDDDNIPQTQKNERIAAGEEYDPTGMKTFMAVATNMRFSGNNPTPTSGKPDLYGDYEWDERYTAIAVVNWVREGFGWPAVE
jgi:hypothetical protein